MPRTSAPALGRLVAAVAAVLTAALLALAPAAPAGATGSGIIRGAITFPHHDRPPMKVLVFDSEWHYLTTRSLPARNSYSLTLPAGSYRLQFVDRRPSYVVSKYAPTDVLVSVRANDLSSRSVTMRRGGFVTGVVTDGRGRPAANARVVAANTQRNSFSTTADSRGRFAIGGLPQSRYSIFTWDRHHRWVAKSTWAGMVRPGSGPNVRVRLRTAAGTMTTYLFTPDGLLRGSTSVTVTSLASGQWWTARAVNGTATFAGLYPGRYRLQFDGLGTWLPQTLTVSGAQVRAGRATFGDVHLTRRAASVSGTVVDVEGATSQALSPVSVSVYNAAGRQVGTATTGSDGRFTISGQLATESVTVVLQPGGPNPPYLHGVSGHYCKFGRTTVTASLTEGQTTTISPAVTLPRLPAAQQDDPATCAS